jgi:hypothetical protein
MDSKEDIPERQRAQCKVISLVRAFLTYNVAISRARSQPRGGPIASIAGYS